jgi:CDP-diglyceride synthetase
MALWHTQINARSEEEESLDSADQYSWEKNQKLQNQTVCALAVALLCALILALLVLDIRFETPFVSGSDSEAEPLTGSFVQSTSPGTEVAYRTWLFVSLSFISGILILIGGLMRSEMKRQNRLTDR